MLNILFKNKFKWIKIYLCSLAILVLLAFPTMQGFSQDTLTINKVSYAVHSPIVINGDADFMSQAPGEGWDIGGRDGSSTKPFLIENLDISDLSTHGNLIDIRNTQVFFEIRDSHLHEGGTGIFLADVSNARIINNTIDYNTINGIYFENTNRTIISNNGLFASGQNGISGNVSAIVSISNNTLASSTVNGISFNTVVDSTITNNIFIINEVGFYLNDSSSNVITDNLFNNTNSFAIKFTDSTLGNNFTCNSVFKGGTSTSSFGYDDGQNNLIDKNYWSNWSGSGTYSISSASPPGNADQHPYASMAELSQNCYSTTTTTSTTTSTGTTATPGFEIESILGLLLVVGLINYHRRKAFR